MEILCQYFEIGSNLFLQKAILISGGASFLGSHLPDRLIKRTDLEKVCIVDKLWAESVENIVHIYDMCVEILHGKVENISTDSTFNEIIHLALPASPHRYMKDLGHVIIANLLGSMDLIEISWPAGRFCFTSTSEIYDDLHVTPQAENYRDWVDCTGPRSCYDESKRCTEALLFQTQAVFGLDLRVARLFNTYGSRTRIDDGRTVSNFMTQALTTGVVTVYGDGTQTRSWGHVDDTIDPLERYFWLDDIRSADPLNIGNDREIPVIDSARYVTKLDTGSRIEHQSPSSLDPTNRRPDLTLAKRVLPGRRASVEYEEGVARTLEWYRPRVGQLDAISGRRPARAAAGR